MGLRHDPIYAFASDPLVTSDINSGFQIGDDWKNTSTKKVFTCADNAAGAAIWINVTDVISGTNVFVDGPVVIGPNASLVPPTLTADQDNYNPAGLSSSGVIQKSFLILVSSLNVNITGIVAPSPAKGNRIIVFNAGSSNITLINNSGSSDPINRFLSSTNKVIQGGESVEIVYSTLLSRWIIISL